MPYFIEPVLGYISGLQFLTWVVNYEIVLIAFLLVVSGTNNEQGRVHTPRTWDRSF